MNVNIEAERVRCQLTKEELSAYLGIVPKTYSNYIKNKTPIPSNVLIQLADLFHCTVDYLLGRTQDRSLSIDQHSA